jgi:hypothetical protein
MPKFADFMIDFAVPAAPEVTKDYIGFRAKALFFNLIQGWRDLPNRGDPIPLWDYNKPHPL